MTDKQTIAKWQKRLRLMDWHIGTSPTPCDEADTRSTVDIDSNTKRAVIRFDPTLPADQRERQIVHEVLHVRLVGPEHAFLTGDPDEAEQTWWKEGMESAIEALVDAFLPDEPRYEYRGGAVWSTAKW